MYIDILETLIKFQNFRDEMKRNNMRSESERMSQGDYTQIMRCNFPVPAMYSCGNVYQVDLFIPQ